MSQHTQAADSKARPPFRVIREQAEERAAMLEFESGMDRDAADADAIRWAMSQYGVKLMVVEDAEETLPLSNLTGCVLWPVVQSQVTLTNEEKFDALTLVAMRTRKKHEAGLSGRVADMFEDAVLAHLAAKHGVTIE